MVLAGKNLDTPDEKRSSEHGEMSVATLAGATIVRAVFRPGWRWSTDIGPGAAASSCQVQHTGYIVSGRFAVRMDDGTELEFGPGDAHVAGPGHDAWVVGGEPCVIIDIAPAPLAAPRGPGARRVQCHPCGIEFLAQHPGQVDELVAAVQQHASGSHGHDVAREHILAELAPA